MAEDLRQGWGRERKAIERARVVGKQQVACLHVPYTSASEIPERDLPAAGDTWRGPALVDMGSVDDGSKVSPVRAEAQPVDGDGLASLDVGGKHAEQRSGPCVQ